MIPLIDLLKVIIMFWPLVPFLLTLLFLSAASSLLLFGGVLIILSFFLYGVYAGFRDLGIVKLITKLYKRFVFSNNDKIKKNIRESFVVQYNKESENKNTPTLYLCSPHGLYAFSWYIHFSLLFSDWPDALPRPKLAVHSLLFNVPFISGILEAWNLISATEENIVDELKKGNSVAIVLGGVEELNKTENNSIKLVMEKRRGYARIAKNTGVPIVPLITIGENELFPFTEMKWWRGFQKYIYKSIHIIVPLPKWESFKRWIYIINKPLDTPLITHVLDAIKPDGSEEEIRAAYKKTILEFAKTSGLTIEIS